MKISEETLREDPSWISLLMGLPPESFWHLVEGIETAYSTYEQQRYDRPGRKRGVGGGRKCDLPLVIRVAVVLTYLRLHMTQALVAKLFGVSQADVCRDLRRLGPLLQQVLPCPAVWKMIESEQPLTQAHQLKLSDLADGQVLIDATEQPVYRSEDRATRKADYSGKKKQFTCKTQFVTTSKLLVSMFRGLKATKN